MHTKLSIVSTLYESSDYILEFCARCSKAAQISYGNSYEIILVNDGSPDDSFKVALELSETNPHIKLINLSRNFGHYKAMMAGLGYASGQRIFLIDSDLEEDPECLNLFHEKMATENCDVVFGVQAERRGSWFNRMSGRVFYWLFNFMTGLKLPHNLLAARLMTREYVKALLLHEEREVFIAGLWHITGFRQISCPVKKHSSSESTYTFGKKIALIVDSITSFSQSPLVAIFYTGLVIFSLSVFYMVYIFFMRMFFDQIPSGWTSLILSIWLLGGLIILFMGVLGIYLAKVFSEVKRRPNSIVMSTHGFEKLTEVCDE